MRQEKLILFTDSKIYNHEFATIWQAKGYLLQHLPVLRAENIDISIQNSMDQHGVITKHHDITLSDEAIHLFCNDKIDGIIITSTNAIDALCKYFPHKSIKIYTISKALAAKVQVYGYQNIYFATAGQDASGLAETFIHYPPQGILLHLCGEKVRHTLNFKSIVIQTLPVYKMCEIADNAVRLKQIIATNKDALIYVSSEQAIRVMLKYQISLDKMIFKSNYLKDCAKSMWIS